MSRSCSFCGVKGHMISSCNSQEASDVFNSICSKAVDYIVLENRSLQERAKLFYNYLIDRNFYVKELRYAVSKVGGLVRGNMSQLAATFIHSYFLVYLGLQQFPGILTENDRLNINAYLAYWEDLSLGKSINEVEQELNEYFEFLEGLQQFDLIMDSDFDFQTAKLKFPIKIECQTILSNEVDTSANDECFDCSICMEDTCSILDKITFGCKHSFCMPCISRVLQNGQSTKKDPCCALCRSDIKNILVHQTSILENFNTHYCF